MKVVLFWLFHWWREVFDPLKISRLILQITTLVVGVTFSVVVIAEAKKTAIDEKGGLNVTHHPDACTDYKLPKLTFPLEGKMSDYNRSDKDHYSYGSNKTSYLNHYLLDFGVPWVNELNISWGSKGAGPNDTDIKLGDKCELYVLDSSVSTKLNLHAGIDIIRKVDQATTTKDDSDSVRVSKGLAVYPVYKGTVVAAARDVPKWVGYVAIKHTEDIEGNPLSNPFTTTYWHINIIKDNKYKGEQLVKKGDKVTSNTIIGYLADLDNPNVYDRDHLHFGIVKGAKDKHDPGVATISVLEGDNDYINPNAQCFNDVWLKCGSPSPFFTDISREDNLCIAVNYLANQKIIDTYSDTNKNFRPNDNINRAEFIKIVIGARVRIDEDKTLPNETKPTYLKIKTQKEGKEDNSDLDSLSKIPSTCVTNPPTDVADNKWYCPLVQTTCGKPFTDVVIEAWYCPYVQIAKNNGIVGGYDDGSFKPNNPINLAEAIKIIRQTLFETSVDITKESEQTTKDEKPWWIIYVNDIGDDKKLKTCAINIFANGKVDDFPLTEANRHVGIKLTRGQMAMLISCAMN